jgi:hypothetical protein
MDKYIDIIKDLYYANQDIANMYLFGSMIALGVCWMIMDYVKFRRIYTPRLSHYEVWRQFK